MAIGVRSSNFCVPPAARVVEGARAYAKSRNITRLRGGCTCSRTRPDGMAAERGKCYVPCDPEVMRRRVESSLHELGLYPPTKSLSMATYIMARNIASEGGSGTGSEKLALGEALVNRARADGKTLREIALWNGRYFAQQFGRNPAVASKRDPAWDDIVASEYVLSGMSGNIARGATHYFGPAAFGAVRKTAREALETWYRRDSLNWIGHVPGINVRRQMFFRKGERDPRRLAEARIAIQDSSPDRVMNPPECSPFMTSVALPLAMGAVAAGALGFMLWARKRALS